MTKNERRPTSFDKVMDFEAVIHNERHDIFSLLDKFNSNSREQQAISNSPKRSPWRESPGASSIDGLTWKSFNKSY
jgi:hypothetical protein